MHFFKSPVRLKIFALSLAMTVGASFALNALADPPAHAPAHGWRKKHDPNYIGYQGRAWPQDYGVIQGRCNRDTIGTVLGGAVGAAVGSQVGDGSGRKVAIVVGAVLGAVIGREIGRNMDEKDRACFGHALELGKSGQPVAWFNPSTGVNYLLTPDSGAQDRSGNCRNYALKLTRDGRSQLQNGRACRSGDGEWRGVMR